MLSIHKVHMRYKALHESRDKSRLNVSGLLNILNERYNYNTIKTLTENTDQISLDDRDRMEFMLDQLEKVCENESESAAKAYTNIICNEANLLKHATNVANSVKQRLASIKAKITGKSVNNQNKLRQANRMGKLERNANGRLVSKDTRNIDREKKSQDKIRKQREKDKDQVNFECCQMILNTINENINYDRIWQTHNRINQRFNTKKIFDEEYRDINAYVKEFSMLLDTYDIPFRAKINICLENIAYEYDRNNKGFDKSKIAEAVTEYFLINNSIFNEQMIYEEANNHIIIQKIVKNANRLVKSSNETASSIGNLVLKTFVSMKDVGKVAGVTLLNVLGKVLSGVVIIIGLVIIGGVGIAALIGVALLLIGIAIGIITILIGVGIAVIISPDVREKLKDFQRKNKNKKINKSLSKLNQIISKCDENVAEQSMLMEAYCETEYECNKYDIEYVLTHNKFYSQKEIANALNIINYDEDKPKFNLTLEDTLLGISEDNKKAISSSGVNKAKSKFKELLNLPAKTATNIKSKIKELYADSPDHIIDEVPNIFKLLVDVCIIAGAIAITPILGIIAAMVIWFINMDINREQASKYIAKFKKEKEKAEKRNKKLTGESKARNEALIKELDKQITKLEDWNDSLYTDEENDKRKGYGNDNDTSNDDYSYTHDITDDDDLKFEAAIDIIVMDKAIQILENFDTKSIYNYLQSKTIDKNVVEYLVKEGCSSGVLNKNKIDNILSDVIYENKNNFKIWNIAKGAERVLNEIGEVNHDLYHRARTALDIQDVMNEMSIGSHITMLKDKIKNAASNLSDKEKVASRTLDSSLESLRHSMENALKQENREAVIRGQVLPPASRIIKLALISGFTFLINPALTVIYLLGVFALSKGLRDKERQLVYDEIETELKVCKEYVEKARTKGDMNAYRQCLQIEKKLLRQRDKLNYNMRVHYNQDVPDRVENK